VSGSCPEGVPTAELVEDELQIVGACDDDTDAHHVQLKQKAKRREIAVIERVLVVPLCLYSDSILVIIDVVSWGKSNLVVYGDLYVEALLTPTPAREEAVNTLTDR
jgi:hypothetical protein